VVHERDQAEVEDRGIKNEEQIVRIPPAIKEVGGHRQPRQPEEGFSQREKHRQHHQQKNQEGPSVKEHERTVRVSSSREGTLYLAAFFIC
jgi:hypothetical protein